MVFDEILVIDHLPEAMPDDQPPNDLHCSQKLLWIGFRLMGLL